MTRIWFFVFYLVTGAPGHFTHPKTGQMVTTPPTRARQIVGPFVSEAQCQVARKIVWSQGSPNQRAVVGACHSVQDKYAAK